MLRDEHVGYYDTGGSLYLPTPGAYLYIDKPPPKTSEKTIRNLFSGRRSQVVHTLLIGPRNWFGVHEIANQALVSPATASQVLTELDRFEWLVSRGEGPAKKRQLREPAALLDAWVKQLAVFRPPKLHRYFVPTVKDEGLMERVGRIFGTHNVRYAVRDRKSVV